MTKKPESTKYRLKKADKALIAQFIAASKEDFTYLESVLKGYHEQFCDNCGKPRDYVARKLCRACAAGRHSR